MFTCELVCLHCPGRMPLDGVISKNKNLFSTFLKAVKFMTKALLEMGMAA